MLWTRPASRTPSVGGLAVTVHGVVRSTTEIDLLVRSADIEPAIDAVRPLGWMFRALPMELDEGTSRERRVSRVTRIVDGRALMLALLEASNLLEPVFAGREQLETPNGALFVVSREGLITLKQISGRAQDLADIEKLEALP